MRKEREREREKTNRLWNICDSFERNEHHVPRKISLRPRTHVARCAYVLILSAKSFTRWNVCVRTWSPWSCEDAHLTQWLIVTRTQVQCIAFF